MKRIGFDIMVIAIMLAVYMFATKESPAGIQYYRKPNLCIPVSEVIIDTWSTASVEDKERVFKCLAEVIFKREKWHR